VISGGITVVRLASGHLGPRSRSPFVAREHSQGHPRIRALRLNVCSYVTFADDAVGMLSAMAAPDSRLSPYPPWQVLSLTKHPRAARKGTNAAPTVGTEAAAASDGRLENAC
jgi:hypothetical protein